MAGIDIPPKHDFIPDLLDNGTGRTRAHIDLIAVHGGSAAIVEVLDEIKLEPGTTVVVDRADPMKWDGLLDAVFRHCVASGHVRSSAPAATSTVLCGSGGMAGDRNATATCPFDPLSIVDEQCRDDEVDRLETRVAETMANGRNAVVTPLRPDHTDSTVRRAWIANLNEKSDGRDPASVVIENLGEVARRLFTEMSPGGLALTGGETGDTDADDNEADDSPVGTTGPDGKRGSVNRKRTGTDERPVIGITLGDPNGVGPEVIVKILSQEWVYELCRPLVIGHAEVIRRALPLVRTATSGDDEGQGGDDGQDDEGGAEIQGDRGSGPCLDIHPIEHTAAALFRYGAIDVMNAQEAEVDRLVPGRVQSDAGRLAVESVKRAARLAMTGDIAAMVTAPINKEAMGVAGYAYAGHTELLAEITGTERFRLALAFDGILVSHATTHVSLRDAVDRLSEDKITVTIDLVGNALAGMGVTAPRIAVCGLNPHAGEGGLFGDEEIRIIAPAIEKVRAKTGARSWRITGPLPPDTVFMRARRGEFDGIIGMYHDQGHIPVKAIAFDRTVNVTLGLPIIRTSVDHGTAFDIAGRGIADAGNLGEALRMAVKLVGEQWSIGDRQGADTAT